VLVVATVVALLATMLVLALAHETAMRLEARQGLRFGATALAGAQAGLEAGARRATASTTWRSDATTWLNQRAVGDARVTVVASDPVDGHLEPNGGLGSSSADGVRLTSTATYRGVARVLQADYLPLPHLALNNAVYGQTHVCGMGVTVEGRLRANGDVFDYGAVTIHGDVTTVTGATVYPSLDDADTDVFYVSTALAFPAVGFSWFQAAGQCVSLPASRRIYNTRITATFNPYGTASARGIYWIDAGGGDVYLCQVAIEACLVVLNANVVYVSTTTGIPTAYYHHSPDPDRLPALVVEGDLTMRVEGGQTISLTVGSTTVTYTSDMEGIFLCTGDFWGPQLDATTAITVDGTILGDALHLRGPGTLIRHDPNLNLNPVVEMTRNGLRLVATSTQEG
jgi:hypothetical protein